RSDGWAAEWWGLDLATGKLVETTIVEVETYQGEPIDGQSEYVLMIHVRGFGLDGGLVSPVGETLGVFDDSVPGLTPNTTIHDKRSFSLVHTYGDQDRKTVQDYLLDRGKRLIAAPTGRVLEMENRIAATVPGSSVDDDLWAILQRDGTFATPP